MEELRAKAAAGDFKAKSELRRMEMAGSDVQDTKDEMAAIQVFFFFFITFFSFSFSFSFPYVFLFFFLFFYYHSHKHIKSYLSNSQFISPLNRLNWLPREP